MTRIEWNETGSRLYETGLDRGVLYVHGALRGVAWNGLVNVQHDVDGGDSVSHHIDGYKYRHEISPHEFKATIDALSTPSEFSDCIGERSDVEGLSFGQQYRKAFDLCYRTLVGNDTDGPDYGYKLHFIYNAKVTPSQQTHSTVSKTAEPAVSNWGISVKPMRIEGYRPTSKLTLDSRGISSGDLSLIEQISYGTAEMAPRMPTPEELIDILT